MQISLNYFVWIITTFTFELKCIKTRELSECGSAVKRQLPTGWDWMGIFLTLFTILLLLIVSSQLHINRVAKHMWIVMHIFFTLIKPISARGLIASSDHHQYAIWPLSWVNPLRYSHDDNKFITLIVISRLAVSLHYHSLSSIETKKCRLLIASSVYCIFSRSFWLFLLCFFKGSSIKFSISVKYQFKP